MIGISLAGLIGAIIGTVIAALNYAAVIGFVERSLRAHDESKTPEEREAFERKIALMRRIVLTGDILAFGGLGYFIGQLIVG